jgi:CPA2 family monovalent cation:H+ antiporter-2
VVIVGYGRVGRAIGKLLDGQGVPHVAIERRPGRVARLRAEGAAVFHGDAGQIEILERLGLGRAAALAVTMDDAAAVRRLVEAVHRTWPELRILARVHDEAHAQELLAAGADHVTPEATEASLQLGEAVLVALGIPEEAARRLVDDEREAARGRLYRSGVARAA